MVVWSGVKLIHPQLPSKSPTIIIIIIIIIIVIIIIITFIHIMNLVF